jgi:hypothetical protein
MERVVVEASNEDEARERLFQTLAPPPWLTTTDPAEQLTMLREELERIRRGKPADGSP